MSTERTPDGAEAELTVAVTVQHPAHVHFYRHPIAELRRRGHAVHVFAREKDVTTDLLAAFDIDHTVLAREPRSRADLLRVQARYELGLLRACRRLDPDVLTAVGGTTAAHVGWLLGARSVVFIDSGITPSNRVTVPFADEVCTPGGSSRTSARASAATTATTNSPTSTPTASSRTPSACARSASSPTTPTASSGSSRGTPTTTWGRPGSRRPGSAASSRRSPSAATCTLRRRDPSPTSSRTTGSRCRPRRSTTCSRTRTSTSATPRPRRRRPPCWGRPPSGRTPTRATATCRTSSNSRTSTASCARFPTRTRR
ncbi:hypothetical protein [Halosegnis marinus]|uniref:hypothetical protein n=1 Tax=Halosegnis marinus TaxID=3034023 RepID=UPI00361BD9B4